MKTDEQCVIPTSQQEERFGFMNARQRGGRGGSAKFSRGGRGGFNAEYHRNTTSSLVRMNTSNDDEHHHHPAKEGDSSCSASCPLPFSDTVVIPYIGVRMLLGKPANASQPKNDDNNSSSEDSKTARIVRHSSSVTKIALIHQRHKTYNTPIPLVPYGQPYALTIWGNSAESVAAAKKDVEHLCGASSRQKSADNFDLELQKFIGASGEGFDCKLLVKSGITNKLHVICWL